MRTKTTILTAALIAAGALSSMAQNVYSLNVVGYVNLDIKAGLNLITPQLVGSANDVTTVLGSINLAENSLLYLWDGAHQTFFNAQIASQGVWYDPNTGNPSTSTISPGQAAFLNNAGPRTNITLVGTVPQGTNNITVIPGLNFVGDAVPISQNIVTNGFPIQDNTLLYTFNPTAQGYNNALIGGGPGAGGSGPGGSDFFDPNSGNAVGYTPAVGEGLVVLYTGNTSTTWVRTFTVQ